MVSVRNIFDVYVIYTAMKNRGKIAVSMLAFVVACTFVVGISTSCTSTADPTGPTSTVLPAFTQNDTAGVPVSLSDFRGNIVVVEFWATWCGPCRAQRPWVRDFVARTSDSGVAMVGISLDYDLDAWRNYIRENNLRWTQLSDGRHWENAVARQYGIQATPTFIIFDRQGNRVGDRMSFSQMEKRIEEMLAAESK